MPAHKSATRHTALALTLFLTKRRRIRPKLPRRRYRQKLPLQQSVCIRTGKDQTHSVKSQRDSRTNTKSEQHCAQTDGPTQTPSNSDRGDFQCGSHTGNRKINPPGQPGHQAVSGAGAQIRDQINPAS